MLIYKFLGSLFLLFLVFGLCHKVSCMLFMLGHQATGTGQQSAGIGHQAVSSVSHPATGMGHQARGMSLQSNYLGLASASAIMNYAECSVQMAVAAPTLQPVPARSAVPTTAVVEPPPPPPSTPPPPAPKVPPPEKTKKGKKDKV